MSIIISKIEAKVKLKEALKKRLEQLEELKLSDFILDEEIDEIEKEISKIKSQLDIKIEKKLSDLNKVFNNFDLNIDKIENTKFEYLYDNFIVKNEITMFAAPPANGKSLLSVALSNIFLKREVVRQVIYFDADNSATTLKNRNIHLLKKKHGNKLRYIHESMATKSQMFQIINQLQKTDLTDVFIVFDSIKNFMQNGDRDKNRDVSKVMDTLKALRTKGATILFLHHTNKPQKDVDELVYAGSSAWQEDTSNAYILQKNEYKNTFILKSIKARTGELKNLAFTYNGDHTISDVDFQIASEDEISEEIRKEIQFLLKEKSLIFSQIIKELQNQGYPYNKIVNVLKNGTDKFWNKRKMIENNKSVYSLIINETTKDFKETIVIYQNPKETQNTVKELKKLKKSYFRGFNELDKYQSSQSSPNRTPIIVNNGLNQDYIQMEVPII